MHLPSLSLILFYLAPPYPLGVKGKTKSVGNKILSISVNIKAWEIYYIFQSTSDSIVTGQSGAGGGSILKVVIE